MKLQIQPDLFGSDTLVFPNERGGFVDPDNFRRRVFNPLVRQALEGDSPKKITIHSLRHTFASLHLSRGTNLLWVQQMGGWSSTQVLLDTYAHFVPTELIGMGFADALAHPDGPMRPRAAALANAGRSGPRRTPAGSRPSLVSAAGIEPGTGGLREHEGPED